MEKNDGVNARIALLRKKLNLTQSQFAEKIGLKRSALSLIEIGKNPLTEQNMKLICLTSGVSRKWLESGEGEMFDCLQVQDIVETRLLESFRQLPFELKESVINHVSILAVKLKER